MRGRTARGFTLIELMVTLVIMSIAIAATALLMIQGARMVRDREEIADNNEQSRQGMEAMLSAVRRAGLGASGGVQIAPGGTLARVNAMRVVDSSAGPDELWVISPHRNVMTQACEQPGGSAAVVSVEGGLTLSCNVLENLPDPAANYLLMISDMDRGVLAAEPEVDTSSLKLTFANSAAAGLGTAISGAGFQKGDRVFPVEIIRFFVTADGSGVPALFRENYVLSASAANPLQLVTDSRRLLARYIEDFQIAVGVDSTLMGDADSTAFQHGLAMTPFVPGVRSLRVSLVSVAANPLRNTDGQVRADPELAPQDVENHDATNTPDGRRRNLMTRRVELANLDPVFL